MIDRASRILVVQQNWLGDVLFASPSLRALKKKFPNAYLVCLGPKRVAEALLHDPHVDEVWTYQERASASSIFQWISLLARIRLRRFDTAVFFHRSRSRALLTRLAGVKQRVGFRRAGSSRHLTHAVEEPLATMHKIDRFLYLLNEVGVPADGRWVDFAVTPAEESVVNGFLMDRGIGAQDPLVCVHPAGNWDLKRWPREYFERWIRLVLERTTWRVALCGAESERSLVEAIVSSINDPRVFSLCGKTRLGELAALLKRSSLLISNDSGPIHLAASQKTRIVGLFGPTSPSLTGPVSQAPMTLLWKDVGCEVPCYFRSCDRRACLELITPEEAFESAKELVG